MKYEITDSGRDYLQSMLESDTDSFRAAIDTMLLLGLRDDGWTENTDRVVNKSGSTQRAFKRLFEAGYIEQV